MGFEFPIPLHEANKQESFMEPDFQTRLRVHTPRELMTGITSGQSVRACAVQARDVYNLPAAGLIEDAPDRLAPLEEKFEADSSRGCLIALSSKDRQ